MLTLFDTKIDLFFDTMFYTSKAKITYFWPALNTQKWPKIGQKSDKKMVKNHSFLEKSKLTKITRFFQKITKWKNRDTFDQNIKNNINTKKTSKKGPKRGPNRGPKMTTFDPFLTLFWPFFDPFLTLVYAYLPTFPPL